MYLCRLESFSHTRRAWTRHSSERERKECRKIRNDHLCVPNEYHQSVQLNVTESLMILRFFNFNFDFFEGQFSRSLTISKSLEFIDCRRLSSSELTALRENLFPMAINLYWDVTASCAHGSSRRAIVQKIRLSCIVSALLRSSI